MKIAVPLYGTRVSPRLDCAPMLWLANISGGRVTGVADVVNVTSNPLQQAAWLRSLGVQAVVCGAITGFALRHLTANGIATYPWVSGEAGDVLQKLASGELGAAATAPPPMVPVVGRRRGQAGGRGRGGRRPRRSR